MTIFVALALLAALGPLSARFGRDSRDGRDWTVLQRPAFQPVRMI